MNATPTTPNTGRILDYWLGGDHHYPVDVEGAKLFESVYGGFPAVFRDLRDYIGRASRHLAGQGIDQFIVLGAGLPTCDNVHEAVPGARVLYTDIDATNVALGQEILAEVPGVGYTFCDASDWDSLDQDVVEEVLGTPERLGLVFVGACAFIPDEVLAGMLAQLHAHVPSGSMIALDFDGEALARHPAALEMLDGIGAPLYMRNPATIAPLLGPWHLDDAGILPASVWPDREAAAHVDPSDVFMYGCVAHT